MKKVPQSSDFCVGWFVLIKLLQLLNCFWLWLFFRGWQEIIKFGLEGGIIIDFDQTGLKSEVQEERLFLFDIFQDDWLFKFKVKSLKVLDLIGPEADFYSFKFVSDHNSDNISLVIGGVLLVRGFFLNFVNNSNHIDILVLAKVSIMIPMEKFFCILACNFLICNLMDFVLFVFKPYLR
jgi:hypothetical protein